MTSLRERILQHASSTPYDPAARRERYLRTRELKGRRAGSTPPPPENRPTASDKGSKVPKGPEDPGGSNGKAEQHPPGTPITPERVAALKVRLDALKEVLAKLVEAAKDAAGVETPSKEDKKSADSKDEAKKPEKPKTAAEKKEAAKKAKETRDKEPDKPDTAASVKAEIASVQGKIEDARAKLAAARKAASSKKPPPKFQQEKDDKPKPKPPAVWNDRQPK